MGAAFFIANRPFGESLSGKMKPKVWFSFVARMLK
jgi:hypothetical protein